MTWPKSFYFPYAMIKLDIYEEGVLFSVSTFLFQFISFAG